MKLNTTGEIAKHLREFYTGKNWTWVWFQDVIDDITWEEANTKIQDLNTIALLVFHMNFYVKIQIRVLMGGELDSTDKDAFNAPAIKSAQDWKDLLEESYRDAGDLAALIQQMPDEDLGETFANDKYGSFYRNFDGNIEHLHYHLGQIVLLKKLIRKK